MNARSAPAWVGETHSPDEISDFTRYRWTACRMAALPLPVQPKSPTMPADHGLGLDDNQHGPPVRPQLGQPNSQQAVSSAQSNAMALVRALQDQDLMAQGE